MTTASGLDRTERSRSQHRTSSVAVLVSILLALSGCELASGALQSTSSPTPEQDPITTDSGPASPDSQPSGNVGTIPERDALKFPFARPPESDVPVELPPEPIAEITQDPEPQIDPEPSPPTSATLSVSWWLDGSRSWPWSSKPSWALQSSSPSVSYTAVADKGDNVFLVASVTRACAPCPHGSSCNGGSVCMYPERRSESWVYKFDGEGREVWGSKFEGPLAGLAADAAGAVYLSGHLQDYQQNVSYWSFLKYAGPDAASVSLDGGELRTGESATVDCVAIDASGTIAYATRRSVPGEAPRFALRHADSHGVRDWTADLPMRTTAIVANPNGSIYVLGRGSVDGAPNAIAVSRFDSQGTLTLVHQEHDIADWAGLGAGGALYAIHDDRTTLHVCTELENGTMRCTDQSAPLGTKLLDGISGSDTTFRVAIDGLDSDDLFLVRYANDLAQQPLLRIALADNVDHVASGAQRYVYVVGAGSALLAKYALPSP